MQIRALCAVRGARSVTVSIIAALGCTTTARAQALEEVVVTAQKRSQDVQDVPAAITAYSGAQLVEMGVTDTRMLAGHIPNLQFNSLQGAGGAPSLAIRGIGISTFTDDNENPVSFYVDDVYVGTLGGVMARTFDMERVEVLRGPQGTLYGRNTTGGLVHFVTKDPTPEFDANASGGLGSFDRRTVEGAVGGPLGDRFGTRVAYSHNEHAGFQRSYTTGTEHGAEKTDSVRAKLEFKATDNLTTMLSLHYVNLRGDSWASDHFGELDPVTGAACSVADVFARRCIDVFGWKETVTLKPPASVLPAMNPRLMFPKQ